MSTIFIQRFSRFIGLLLLQLLLLNHIHVLGYICPVVIAALLLGFERGSNRIGLLVWGFSIGLVYDLFSNTQGMGMAASTLCAMLQPTLLQVCSPRDVSDDFVPSIRSMTLHRYVLYAASMMLIFHTVFYVLDAFLLRNWQLSLLAIGISSALALLLVLLSALIFQNHRGQTNS